MTLPCSFHLETAGQAGNSPIKIVVLAANCASLGRGLEALLGWKILQGTARRVVCHLVMPQAVKTDLPRFLEAGKIDALHLQAVDLGHDLG